MGKVFIPSLLFIAFSCTFGYCQDQSLDLSLIANKHKSTIAPKEKSKFINYTPPYWVYAFSKEYIAPQLSLTDQYQMSLGQFTAQSFKLFGPIKGVFMCIDRINRTGRLGYIDFPSVRLNANRKIDDHPRYYKVK